MTAHYALEGQRDYFGKLVGIPITNLIHYYKNRILLVCKDKEEINKIQTKQREDAKNSGFIIKILNEFKDLIKEKYRFLAIQNPLNSFKEFSDFYRKYWVYHLYAYNLGLALQNRPDERLLSGFNKELEEVRKEHPYHEIEEEYLKNLFDSMKTNIENELLYFCLPEEILAFIEGNKLPSREELEARSEEYLNCIIEGKTMFFTKEEAKKNFSKYVSEILDDYEKKCIVPGKVKGHAKIVVKNNDFSKVEEGDIIIAHMTTPEYVPIMEKASAFLTDEGGILCHAAIIARELKKPCIVGMKNATDKFKDGDLVEVDANKGIVRKI